MWGNTMKVKFDLDYMFSHVKCEDIVKADKTSPIYFTSKKIKNANYIIMLKFNRFMAIPNKNILKKVIDNYKIDTSKQILSWDSDNKRYDLYKIEWCI